MDTETREPAGPARARHGRHPTPKEYIRIALILGVITAAEVAIYYLDFNRTLFIATLFVFSIVKFSLVVLWFMHLKFDSRTYSRFFLMGLAMAITLYLIVLISFRVFQA